MAGDRQQFDAPAASRLLIALLLATSSLGAGVAFAGQGPRLSGHGPVFGMATPTNADDAWAIDVGLMGRSGEDETGAMLRTMFTYGITEDLQVSWSMPLVFSSAALTPARMAGMMPGSGDLEAIGAWRFHRRGARIGTRFESTAYAGAIIHGPQRPQGMARDLKRALGSYTAVSTGVASRSHYAWGAVGYSRFAESEGDRRPDVLFYSGVWGYRPPPLQKEYPHWDWRLFVELTGERSGILRRDGQEMSETRGHQIFLGPATLGIYKNIAIQGGLQFPVYRDVNVRVQRERFRFALNFAYFL